MLKWYNNNAGEVWGVVNIFVSNSKSALIIEKVKLFTVQQRTLVAYQKKPVL